MSNGPAEEGGAEAFDQPGHGIEVEQPAPVCRHQARRIDDGRREHPELDHEGDDVAEIAIGDGQRRQEGADAERREHDASDEQRRQRAG